MERKKSLAKYRHPQPWGVFQAEGLQYNLLKIRDISRSASQTWPCNIGLTAEAGPVTLPTPQLIGPERL
jgi:hypothetical protein